MAKSTFTCTDKVLTCTRTLMYFCFNKQQSHLSVEIGGIFMFQLLTVKHLLLKKPVSTMHTKFIGYIQGNILHKCSVSIIKTAHPVGVGKLCWHNRYVFFGENYAGIN